MKTGFSEPIKIDGGKEKKNPWNFDCPAYDERTSCYVDAGWHHGVGKRQPVGHSGNPKKESPALPQDRRRVRTMEVDESPRKMLRPEIED